MLEGKPGPGLAPTPKVTRPIGSPKLPVHSCDTDLSERIRDTDKNIQLLKFMRSCCVALRRRSEKKLNLQILSSVAFGPSKQFLLFRT